MKMLIVFLICLAISLGLYMNSFASNNPSSFSTNIAEDFEEPGENYYKANPAKGTDQIASGASPVKTYKSKKSSIPTESKFNAIAFVFLLVSVVLNIYLLIKLRRRFENSFISPN